VRCWGDDRSLLAPGRPVIAALPARAGHALPEWLLPVTRRPVGVAVTGLVVLVAIGLRIGPHPALAAFYYLGVVGVMLAVIDIELERLPDPLTLPSYPVAALLLELAAVVTGHGATRFTHALLGMAALGLLYGVQWLIVPGQIGLGDVKLAGVLGLYLGWLGLRGWLLGVCAGFILGAIYSVALLIGRRANLRSEIPFGPFMVAGTLVAVLAT
jgi:leader peptidase (prepilin peptidase) / N-methyltransferase